MAGPTLLLATSNPGKRAEMARLLPPHFHILTLLDVPISLPDEAGSTFAEIASAKSRVASATTGLIALADDSGLEVDALGGAPGLRTARYAGEHATDAENRAKLLSDLERAAGNGRTARFRCAVALAEAGRVLALEEDVCEGSIATEERGERGFGYDPLFVLPDGRTMAELDADDKDRLSHRGKALARLRPMIAELIGLAWEAPR